MALIMDDIQELRKVASQGGSAVKKFDRRSFAAKAKDSTFQFPCLFADSIPVSTSSTLTNYIEPVYADFTQSVLSLDSRINLSTTNIDQWLKKQHQNITLESMVGDVIEPDEFMGIFENAYDGNAVLYLNSERDAGIMVRYTTENGSQLMESNREGMSEYLSQYDLRPFNEASVPESTMNNTDVLNAYITGKQAKNERDVELKKHDIIMRSTTQSTAPKLLDRDVKKMNNMRPYGLEVKLIAIDDAGNVSQFVSIVIGIKAYMHSISSEEMIQNLGNAVNSKSSFMNMVKWTTGEISFLKDFLLHINEIKMDVSNMANGYSKWFPTLKHLKDKKVQFRSSSLQRLIPNASIIISTYELNEIQTRYGINLKDPRFAKKIISNYFLMTFIVIDDATQTIDIIYEKDSVFQTYALETLEREVNLNSNRLSKEIGRMISR